MQFRVTDDRKVVTKRFERLQRSRKCEVFSFFGRRPVVFRSPGRSAAGCSVHHFNRDKPWLRGRGGLLEARLRRDHRIQKGKAQGYAEASQDRPPRQMSLGDEHDEIPPLIYWERRADTGSAAIALRIGT